MPVDMDTKVKSTYLTTSSSTTTAPASDPTENVGNNQLGILNRVFMVFFAML